MRAIFVDLDNDIKEIAAEVEMLGLALDTHKATKINLAPHMFWLAISGLASEIEKVYSECERVMAAIASFVVEQLERLGLISAIDERGKRELNTFVFQKPNFEEDDEEDNNNYDYDADNN